jgi:hypothetical protein
MLKKIFKMLGLNGDAPVESVIKPKRYRLKAYISFYKGLPPTINESAMHLPSEFITPFMVLVLKFETESYYGFEVVCNEESGGAGRNGERVYYDKDLFNNLRKTELK